MTTIGRQGTRGVRTTEFYMYAAVVVLNGLIAAGVIADGSMAARLAGAALATLAALGYGAGRTAVKRTPG